MWPGRICRRPSREIGPLTRDKYWVLQLAHNLPDLRMDNVDMTDTRKRQTSDATANRPAKTSRSQFPLNSVPDTDMQSPAGSPDHSTATDDDVDTTLRYHSLFSDEQLSKWAGAVDMCVKLKWKPHKLPHRQYRPIRIPTQYPTQFRPASPSRAHPRNG